MHVALASSRPASGPLSKIGRAFLPVLLLAQVLGASAASAAPAAPDVVKTFQQPNGSEVLLSLWGDEYANGWETLSGHTVIQNGATGAWEYAIRAASGHLIPSGIAAGVGAPPVGRHLRPAAEVIDELREAAGAPLPGALLPAPPWAGADTAVLFIMVEFSDVGCSYTPAQMAAVMFGGSSTGPGNLEDYYEEISNGALDFDGTVVGNSGNTDCIALANTKASYDNAAGGDITIVNEAVAAADSYVNFSDYDNDGDGWVDALGIIYAGGGAHDGCGGTDADDSIWPNSDGTGGTTTNEADVNSFIINSEITRDVATNTCDEAQSIGLFAHELGHSLGIPDLYDTDDSSEGVGWWSTMASQYRSTTVLADTPPHFDPWSKWYLGWVSPTDLTSTDGQVNMAQVETTQQVGRFLANPGGPQIGGSGEYFLVENRQQVGFDAQLPGCGILVWHIDEAQTNNRNEGHSSGSHRLVDLEEADGLDELDGTGDRGDTGDPFPGSTNNTLFAGSTDPHSDLYDGSDSGVRVRVQTGTCASTMALSVGPNDVPVAVADGPYVTIEGTNIGLNGSGSSDADGDALTYDWDPNGVFVNPNIQNPTFDAVGQDGPTGVTLTVTDPDGASDSDTSTVTVNNVAPSVSLGSDAPKDEGSLVTVTGTISDPGWLDPLTATIDWGDGAGAQPLAGTLENTRPNATLSFSVGHRYGDNGLYPVEVCGSDDDVTTCDTINLQIDNVAPTVTFDPAPDTSLEEFDTSNVRVTFTDPGWLDTYSAQVTWGEGTTDNPAAVVTTEGNPGPDMGEANGSHQYGDNGMYGVSFSVTDDDGGAGAAGFTADVANVDPTAAIDSSSAIIVNGMETIIAHAGENVPFTAESKDPGSDDLLTTWDWDDGAPAPDHVTSWLVNPPFPDAPFPPGSPTVEPRDVDDAKDHTFGDACLYDVAFTSADDDEPLGGSADSIPVIILGNAERSRSYGWWHPQFKENGSKADFDQATLECYLAITRFGSDVFDEERPLSTLEDAHAIFHKEDALSSHQEKLDKILLAAWLNWANGAFDWFQPVVDTDKDKVPDLSFAVAVVNAETVRLNPLSTKDDLEDQKKIMDKFNHYKP